MMINRFRRLYIILPALLFAGFLGTVQRAAAVTLTFDDLKPGTAYHNGETILSSNIPIIVSAYNGAVGGCQYAGHCDQPWAGRVEVKFDNDDYSWETNYLEIERAMLGFNFEQPIQETSLSFKEDFREDFTNEEDSIYLRINNQVITARSLHALSGLIVGGVEVSVATLAWDGMRDGHIIGGMISQLFFGGTIYDFAIGSTEELRLDNFVINACPTDSVPEPASILLFSMGLGGLIVRKRRSKSKKAV
jgi:hypothetical protein